MTRKKNFTRKKKFNQYGTRTRNPQMATVDRSRIEVWYAVHCANWFASARAHYSAGFETATTRLMFSCR